MSKQNSFLAVGEEAARGTKEASTVGFIPLMGTFPLPKPDKMAIKVEEFRGPNALLGHSTERHMGEKWEGLSLEMPGFSEAGTVKGMYGTLFKHFMGKAVSAENASTGQYAHMIYPVEEMFATANLGAKGLTFNMNSMQEATLKNYPYVGGRVSKLSFKQERALPLVLTAEAMGQKLDTLTAGLGSLAWPAENLRFDYNNLTIRTGGTVTRAGTAPDYTNITSNGDQIKPESISLELERGMTDEMLLNGTTSPAETYIGVVTGKLSIVIDFRDPASGFSSVTEFMAWLEAGGASEIDVLLTWDSGTQAGTGLNHQLIIDLPRCNRLGGMPDLPRDSSNSKITLEYDLHLDETTTLYAAGLLLINTAASV